METLNETPKDNGGGPNQYISIDQFLTDANVALTNAQLPDIEPLLLKRGLKKSDIVAKQASFKLLGELNEQQKKEYGESYQATAGYTAQQNTLHEDYIDHLGLARIALKNNVAAQTALGLKGKRKQDDAGYCKQALLLYNGLLGSDDYKTSMLTKGVDAAELTAMQTGYTDLEKMGAAKSREYGEAQAATAGRDTLYEELEEWFSDFKATAIIALRKNPQFREQLGFLER